MLINKQPLQASLCLSIWSGWLPLEGGGGTLKWMSHLISFSVFAKGQFRNARRRARGCMLPFAHLTHQEMDRIANGMTFCSRCVSHRVYFCSVHGQWSHCWTVGAFISASHPNCLFHFHFQTEQTVPSLLPFFPSFVRQCNCTTSKNRKELPQSVKELLVKTSFRGPFSQTFYSSFFIFNQKLSDSYQTGVLFIFVSWFKLCHDVLRWLSGNNILTWQRVKYNKEISLCFR